jgi:hypothetical protein
MSAGKLVAAMTDPTMTSLHGVPTGAAATFVDRAGGVHHLVAAGPYLRCEDHTGRKETDNVADALDRVSKARNCERLRVAWQRHMLADDKVSTRQLDVLPAPLLAYLADQTRRHVERLDAALGDGPAHPRVRRRWHDTGWRAAPTLAAAYQAAGIESGLAFLALRRHVEPDDVPAAIKDTESALARSMRKSGGSDNIELLDLGFRSMVTDDFPYEPLDE